MKFHNSFSSTIISLYLATGACATALVSCAVCSPTIVYGGEVRKLTLSREEEKNTLQCNYDTPPIPNFSPGCLYQNVNGNLIFTNTASTLFGLPGACPSPAQLVQKNLC